MVQMQPVSQLAEVIAAAFCLYTAVFSSPEYTVDCGTVSCTCRLLAEKDLVISNSVGLVFSESTFFTSADLCTHSLMFCELSGLG